MNRSPIPAILPIALGLLLLASGCATRGSVSQLSLHQVDAFEALLERLEASLGPMQEALEALADLDAEYTMLAFELERSLARAERLDAMNAPWARPADERVETQRAVMLYNLYRVDLAEDKVLEARLAERRQAIDEVLEAYEGLVEQIYGAIEHVDTVSTYLNRPRSERLSELAARLLEQVRGFQQTLEGSESPRLRALAEDVVRFEAEADAARREVDHAINNFLALAEGAGEDPSP